jgi:hypothetical protein
MRTLFMAGLVMFAAGAAVAQFPPDAVQLDKVKISEAVKSTDLDPVTLKPADPALGTFESGGITYGMSDPASKETFMKDPAKYAEKAAKARWEQNFINSMSVIWCPVTDEISPGGNTKWNKIGLVWESCCQFCNDTVTDEDFPRALDRLKVRANKSYDIIGAAKYTEGASSPVEGAIDFAAAVGGAPEPAPAPAPAGACLRQPPAAPPPRPAPVAWPRAPAHRPRPTSRRRRGGSRWR